MESRFQPAAVALIDENIPKKGRTKRVSFASSENWEKAAFQKALCLYSGHFQIFEV